jgi:hypothetical protein
MRTHAYGFSVTNHRPVVTVRVTSVIGFQHYALHSLALHGAPAGTSLLLVRGTSPALSSQVSRDRPGLACTGYQTFVAKAVDFRPKPASSNGQLASPYYRLWVQRTHPSARTIY